MVTSIGLNLSANKAFCHVSQHKSRSAVSIRSLWSVALNAFQGGVIRVRINGLNIKWCFTNLLMNNVLIAIIEFFLAETCRPRTAIPVLVLPRIDSCQTRAEVLMEVRSTKHFRRRLGFGRWRTSRRLSPTTTHRNGHQGQVSLALISGNNVTRRSSHVGYNFYAIIVVMIFFLMPYSFRLNLILTVLFICLFC